MSAAVDAAKRIVWATCNTMKHCNLSEHMVQHWTHARELNGLLKDLVRFLAIECRQK